MPDRDLTKLKRDELDKLAEKSGVPDPEALPNKEAVAERIEHNPALVQEPPPEPDPAEVAAAQPAPEPGPDEKSYEVVGPVEVLGHKPGSKFAAALPPVQEGLLIESGHIKRLNPED